MKKGLLIINLGSPDSTRVSDVRSYLREFLSDPDVIDLPQPVADLASLSNNSKVALMENC